MESDGGYSRPVENVGESKIISGLVGRIVSKVSYGKKGEETELMDSFLVILA
jgi:hypothetical protein